MEEVGKGTLLINLVRGLERVHDYVVGEFERGRDEVVTFAVGVAVNDVFQRGEVASWL